MSSENPRRTVFSHFALIGKAISNGHRLEMIDLMAQTERSVDDHGDVLPTVLMGTVKFFNAMKGFGFLTRDDGQPAAFVHISAVERSGLAGINEGARYSFDLEVDRRGKYSAVNLVPASD